MSSTIWFSLLFYLFSHAPGIRESTAEKNGESLQKRILLNDQDVIQAQLRSLEAKLSDVTSRLTVLENGNTGNKGVAYIRWGRKDCPIINGTQLVYSGIVGGGAHTEKGNGVNYLCLPTDPEHPQLSGLVPQDSVAFAHVYGAEYQFSFANVKLDDDVPCAACLDTRATTKLMIPGKMSCPVGWRKQYDGLLCSSYFGHDGTSEFECLDINPQYLDGRRANLDGKLFYPAVAVCGSLECPPYEDGRYIGCVVCSK